MCRQPSAGDSQITLDPDGELHEAVVQAREHRRDAGRPESLTTMDATGRLHDDPRLSLSRRKVTSGPSSQRRITRDTIRAWQTSRSAI
jgi:hypothetical protein